MQFTVSSFEVKYQAASLVEMRICPVISISCHIPRRMLLAGLQGILVHSQVSAKGLLFPRYPIYYHISWGLKATVAVDRFWFIYCIVSHRYGPMEYSLPQMYQGENDTRSWRLALKHFSRYFSPRRMGGGSAESNRVGEPKLEPNVTARVSSPVPEREPLAYRVSWRWPGPVSMFHSPTEKQPFQLGGNLNVLPGKGKYPNLRFGRILVHSRTSVRQDNWMSANQKASLEIFSH